jgi:hypothetical protein
MARLADAGLEAVQRRPERPVRAHLGFGRIVASEIEGPNMLANLV